VFNTAMTGYQEILTDPSYCQQIVTLTYPHIGNYGVNGEDVEADKVHAAGLIIRDLPLVASNFRKTATLTAVPACARTRWPSPNIDTRKLTRHLRTNGAQNGCILGLAAGEEVTQALIDKAVAGAKAAPSMAGLDLAKVVSVTQTYDWDQTEWQLGAGYGAADHAQVPRGRLRLRRQEEHPAHAGRARLQGHRGARADARGRRAQAQARRRLPVQRPRRPGALRLRHRAPRRELIETASHLRHLPGPPDHGAGFGRQDLQDEVRPPRREPSGEGPGQRPREHHQPEPRLRGRREDAAGQPAPTHISLFDNTLQGLARTDKPAFCFQGHPEASPGPHDIGYLFDRFTA
jgi:carbamoyl-phosphate synthase small subunit